MIKTGQAIFVLLFITFSGQAQTGIGTDFLGVISSRISIPTQKDSDSSIDKICPINKSTVAKRVLSEYGAMFVASSTVKSPPACLFQNDAEVAAFHSKLDTSFVLINGIQLNLQKAAADSLNAVIVEALAEGISVRPLHGAIAGGRTYADTVRLWNSRFEPALKYWNRQKRISDDEAASVMQMSLEKQIEKVIEWESQGMKFGTGRGSSIFASTAPPGASQHLSLIAVDIAPPLTPSIIALMNSHGWFQTVKGDRPHFTYLGMAEKELPARGLKALLFDGTQYWVPNISTTEVNP